MIMIVKEKVEDRIEGNRCESGMKYGSKCAYYD